MVVCADIREMYLQIELHPEDKPYHKILWRTWDVELRTLQFNRHMFGNAGSPFVAVYTIRKLAEESKEELSLAADAVLRISIIYDLLPSYRSEEEGVESVQQMRDLFARAGMTVGKIITNNARVLESLTETEVLPGFSLAELHGQEAEDIKALGVGYRAVEDLFHVAAVEVRADQVWTKRAVLRHIAKCYDPLGLAGPIVAAGRILFQGL